VLSVPRSRSRFSAIQHMFGPRRRVDSRLQHRHRHFDGFESLTIHSANQQATMTTTDDNVWLSMQKTRVLRPVRAEQRLVRRRNHRLAHAPAQPHYRYGWNHTEYDADCNRMCTICSRTTGPTSSIPVTARAIIRNEGSVLAQPLPSNSFRTIRIRRIAGLTYRPSRKCPNSCKNADRHSP